MAARKPVAKKRPQSAWFAAKMKGLSSSQETTVAKKIRAGSAKKTTAKKPVTKKVDRLTPGDKKDNPFAGIKKGGFHKTLGKKPNAPITKVDIAKGKAKGGKAAKQAVLAENFKKMAAKRKRK